MNGISSLYFSGMYIFKASGTLIPVSGWFINWSRGNEWNLLLVLLWHVHLQSLWNLNSSLSLAISDPQSPCLIVKTVAAAHQLTESSTAWKPGLKVKLLSSSIVQSS